MKHAIQRIVSRQKCILTDFGRQKLQIIDYEYDFDTNLLKIQSIS